MSDPEKRQTSAEIKAEIESKTREMKEAAKNGSIPLTPGVIAQINASTPEASQTPASKPEPTQAAEKEAAPSKESVGLKEWAKKKGYDLSTEESVLSTLRKADQVFHQRQAEKKAKEAVAPQYIPPQAQAYPQNGYPPTYAPPPNPRQVLEELAKQANMTPEDFERVARASRMVYDAAASQDRQRYSQELEAIKLENQKNSVFRELSSDPVFRNPQFAMEYHNIVEEMQAADPTSFEKDPTQYRRAHERALSNIGRRNLEGKPLVEGVPPQVNTGFIPTTPPKPLGQGSGGGQGENENELDMKTWNNLSPTEKKKWFQDRNLVSNY